MVFEKEIDKLRIFDCYSEREFEIRKKIINSLKDLEYVNLWECYCNYLTENRMTQNCNPKAITLVEKICRDVKPPGMY